MVFIDEKLGEAVIASLIEISPRVQWRISLDEA
jgi:hypothetical protein